jgi:hypothetical protein
MDCPGARDDKSSITRAIAITQVIISNFLADSAGNLVAAAAFPLPVGFRAPAVADTTVKLRGWRLAKS